MYLGIIVFVSIIGISIVGIFSIISDGQELSEINNTVQQKNQEIISETSNISAVYTDSTIQFTNTQNEEIHIIQIRVYDGLGNYVESFDIDEIISGNSEIEILSENLPISLQEMLIN